MRSFTWLSSGSPLGHLPAWLAPPRRWLLAVRPAARWLIAAATIAVVACLGLLGASALSTTSDSVYLGAGRCYSWDDLNKIARALDRQRVVYRVDDQRRVSVSESQREQAETTISKLELGLRPPGEIADQSFTSNLWESLHEREIRERRGEEKMLESLIGDLHGIVGCFVRLDRPKAKYGLQPAAKPSAFVRLETEGDRPLPFQTVQSITTILRGYEPGLTAESVTVVDRRGYKYLDAGNPALNVLTHNRAREEELSQEILVQLDWIKGVRVSVQMEDTPAGDGRAPVSRSEPRTDSALLRPRASGSQPGETRPDARGPIGALNRPLGAVEIPASPETPNPAKTPSRDKPAERGRIWVKIPRSYFYQITMSPGRREPSVDELQKLVAKTEEQIKTGLAQVIPLTGSTAWATVIDVIPDEIPLNASSVLPPTADSRRAALDWGIAAAMGALAAALVLLGSWIFTARRPAHRLETAPRGVRYHSGSSVSRGPSERLREFVRRNPDSAVCVLERWTSQGGSPA